MVDKATRSESLLVYVARIIVFTIIIFVAVLVVDAVVLLLLNLWIVDTWLALLWWEGLAIAFFGAAGYWRGENPLRIARLSGKHTYKLKVKYKFPWFWVSVGMAGLVLWIVYYLIGSFIKACIVCA
jgi:hypothetical protein